MIIPNQTIRPRKDCAYNMPNIYNHKDSIVRTKTSAMPQNTNRRVCCLCGRGTLHPKRFTIPNNSPAYHKSADRTTENEDNHYE